LKIEGLFESKMDLEVFTIPVRNWLEKASESMNYTCLMNNFH